VRVTFNKRVQGSPRQTALTRQALNYPISLSHPLTISGAMPSTTPTEVAGFEPPGRGLHDLFKFVLDDLGQSHLSATACDLAANDLHGIAASRAAK
jgi:hypothetical protein